LSAAIGVAIETTSLVHFQVLHSCNFMPMMYCILVDPSGPSHMPGVVQDVITPANFYEDQFRGFSVARVEFWPFPLTCFVDFKTPSHYRAS